MARVLYRRARQRLLVGGINYKGLPREGEVKIGYDVAPAQRNRGYATEAIAALCERAFGRGIARVCADVAVDNLASMRVLSKNGFSQTSAKTEGATRWIKS